MKEVKIFYNVNIKRVEEEINHWLKFDGGKEYNIKNISMTSSSGSYVMVLIYYEIP